VKCLRGYDLLVDTRRSWLLLIPGGILLGFWIYGILFDMMGSPGQYLGWGLVGIAVGGSLYAARLGPSWAMVAAYVTIGISVGILWIAAIDDTWQAWVTLLTLLGSALIALGVPRWQRAPAVEIVDADAAAPE
jgi:hypothetical protein